MREDASDDLEEDDGRDFVPDASAPIRADTEWDAGHMACGELVMELRGRMLALPRGHVLRLVARDYFLLNNEPESEK